MNLKKTGQALVNSVGAILHGELMMRLRLDKYFVHIAYTFFLMLLMIWLSLQVERTMVKVEKQKKVVSDLRIYHAQKTVQLVSLDRISTIEQLLKDAGSEVDLPDKPADRIKK